MEIIGLLLLCGLIALIAYPIALIIGVMFGSIGLVYDFITKNNK